MKTAVIFLFAVLGIVTLSACGGGGGGSAAVPTVEMERQEQVLAVQDSDLPLLRAAGFDQSPGVDGRITIIITPRDFTNLVNALAANRSINNPDTNQNVVRTQCTDGTVVTAPDTCPPTTPPAKPAVVAAEFFDPNACVRDCPNRLEVGDSIGDENNYVANGDNGHYEVDYGVYLTPTTITYSWENFIDPTNPYTFTIVRPANRAEFDFKGGRYTYVQDGSLYGEISASGLCPSFSPCLIDGYRIDGLDFLEKDFLLWGVWGEYDSDSQQSRLRRLSGHIRGFEFVFGPDIGPDGLPICPSPCTKSDVQQVADKFEEMLDAHVQAGTYPDQAEIDDLQSMLESLPSGGTSRDRSTITRLREVLDELPWDDRPVDGYNGDTAPFTNAFVFGQPLPDGYQLPKSGSATYQGRAAFGLGGDIEQEARVRFVAEFDNNNTVMEGFLVQVRNAFQLNFGETTWGEGQFEPGVVTCGSIGTCEGTLTDNRWQATFFGTPADTGEPSKVGGTFEAKGFDNLGGVLNADITGAFGAELQE